MNLSELLSKGLVEKFQPDPKDVKNEIDIAKGSYVYSRHNLISPNQLPFMDNEI